LGQVHTDNGVAIKGYDTVAYHTEGKALVGDEENSYIWNSAEWHFVSDENKILFISDPEKYAPQYGGYCALAVSMGLTFEVEPEQWHILDGKLYLFNAANPKKSFIADLEDGIVAHTDKKWSKR
jgi:hypothetical protein